MNNYLCFESTVLLVEDDGEGGRRKKKGLKEKIKEKLAVCGKHREDMDEAVDIKIK